MKKIVKAISVVALVPIVVATCTLTVAALVFVSATQNSNSSTTQNANSPTTTNKSAAPVGRGIGGPQSAPTPDFSKNTWELPEDADKTKNPISSSPESIAKGKELYLAREKGNCIFCHGEAGSGNEASLPRLRRKPADLTSKERMSSRTDGELFWKITKGITGIMPAGERRMPEAEERWHVVNYVRTLAKDPPKP